MNARIARRMKIAAISLAAWTGLALIFYLQRLYFVSARGSGTAWNQLFLEVSIVWGTWAALTPLVLYIVRRISLSPEWPWRALVHVPTGIGVALLHSLLVAAVTPLFIWKPSFLPIRDIFRSTVTLSSSLSATTVPVSPPKPARRAKVRALPRRGRDCNSYSVRVTA